MKKTSKALAETQNVKVSPERSKADVLAEIAKQQQISGRRNKTRNIIIIVLLILMGLAVLSFGLIMLFAEKKHTVTFYLNTGAYVKTIEIADGGVILTDDIPANPEEPLNMNFKGWFTNQTAHGEPFDFENTPVRNSLRLYAGFEASVVSLKVYYNDGSNNYYTLTGSYGTQVNILNQGELNENLSNEFKDEVNYTLLGFHKEINATHPTYTRYQLVSLFDGNLFAVWQGRKVNVTIKSNEARYWNNTAFQDEVITSYYGSYITVNTSIYQNLYQQGTGARVEGIRVEYPNGESDDFYDGDSIKITDDMIFWLKFEKQPNVLTIAYNYETYPLETYYGYGREITLRTDVSIDNYQLIGYSDGVDTLLPGATITIDGQMSYVAVWESLVYSITLDNDANYPGTTAIYLKYAEGFYSNININSDFLINSIVAPQKNGHNFLGYYTQPNGEGEQIISGIGEILVTDHTMFTDHTTLYAHFELTTFTVTIENNQFGTINPIDAPLLPEGKYQVVAGNGFRFTVTLHPAYTQRYIVLLSKLRVENPSIEKISAGNITAITRFDLANISKDCTITVPELDANEYRIIFRNSDSRNTLLQMQEYQHGDIVEYNQPQPTKESTEDVSYQFIGWSPEFEETALENRLYIADYQTVVKIPTEVPSLSYNGTAQAISIDTPYYTITSNSYTEVGTYTALASLKDDTYVWDDEEKSNDDKEVEWSIVPHQLSIPRLPNETTFEYNGSLQRLSDNLLNFDASLMNIIENDKKDAGSYVAVISLNDSKNYQWSDDELLNTDGNVEVYWTVEKSDLTITANNKSMFYGYPRPSMDYKIEGLQGVDSESTALTSGAIILVTDASSTVEQGDYAITFLNTESIQSANYNLHFINGVFEVRYNTNILLPSLYENEYEYTSNAITPSFVGYNEHVMIIDGDITARDVGDYTITIDLKGSNIWANSLENGEYAGTNNQLVLTWKITPATVIVKANDKVILYGEEQPSYDVTFIGFLGGDNEFNSTTDVIIDGAFNNDAFDFVIKDINDEDYSGSAGDYVIYISAKDGQAHNYLFEFENGTLKVLHNEYEIPTITSVLVYNGEEQNLTSALFGFYENAMNISGNIEKDANADDDGNVIAWYTATISLKDASFRWIGLEGEDASADVTIQWVIQKAELMVKPLDITVIKGSTDIDIVLSYTGFMNEDNENNSINGEFVLNNNANLDEEGEYDIFFTDETTAWSDNYNIVLMPGKLWITTSDSITVPRLLVDTFTYSGTVITPIIENLNLSIMEIVAGSDISAKDANTYSIIIALKDSSNQWSGGGSGNITLVWQITRADLVIKADDIDTYYGDDYQLTYTITGLRPSDSMPFDTSNIELEVEGHSELPSDVGSYIINFINASPQGEYGNYNIKWPTGILLINSPIIDAPYLTRDAFVYSAMEINIASYFNRPLNENVFIITEQGSENLKAKDVGDYIIKLALNENYQWSSDVTLNDSNEFIVSWQITHAQLIVKPKDTTIVYKDEIPTVFEYTISNWQTPEDEVIIGEFAFATNTGANFPVNVGDYIISMSMGTVQPLHNYEFNFETGNLIISRYQLEIPTASQTTFVYSGAERELNLIGFDNGIMGVSGHKHTNVNVVNGIASNYTATITILDKHNYEWMDESIEDKEIEWIIEKAELVVRAISMTIEYLTISENNWPPQFTITYSGFKAGDTQNNAIEGTITVDTDARFDSNAGIYYLQPNVSNATSRNYNFKIMEGVFTILPQRLTIPTVDQSQFYNATFNQFIFDNIEKKLQLFNFDSETMSIIGDIATNADKYVAVISLNYNWNYVWDDGTVNGSISDILINWEILVRLVDKPSVQGSLEYNACEQSPDIQTDDFYTITGNKQTNAGVYIAVVSLKYNNRPDGKQNVIWSSDGTHTDLQLTWHIEKFTPLFTQQHDYHYYYGQLLEFYEFILEFEEATGPISCNIIDVIEGNFEFVFPEQKPGLFTTSASVRFIPDDIINFNTEIYSVEISVEQLVITFDSNGGSYVPSIAGEYDFEYDKPTPDPTRPGYDFTHWYWEDGAVVSWKHPLRTSVTFYAGWQKKDLIVSYYTGSNRGTSSVQFPNDDGVIEVSDKIFHYEEDTPPTYVFDLDNSNDIFTDNNGYRLFERATGKRVVGVQINGVGTVYTSSIVVTESIVLYFVFDDVADSVTIDYKGGSADGLSAELPEDVFKGRGTNLDVKYVKYQFYFLLGFVPAEDNIDGVDATWQTPGLGSAIRLYQREHLNTTKVTQGQHRYYAVWEPINVTFNYHANGGTGNASPQNHGAKYGTNGFVLAQNNNMSRTHFTYEGWTKTTEVNGTREQSSILHFGIAQRVVNLDYLFLTDVLDNYQTYTYQIEDEVMNVTLYASWYRNRIVVNFNYVPGTGSPLRSETDDFFSGEVITNTNNDQRLAFSSNRTGYTQKGWSQTQGGSKLPTSWTVPPAPSGQITLYSFWEPNTTTITLRLNGGNVGGNTSNRTVYILYDSNPPSAFPLPSRTGYTFTGYWTGSSGTGTRVVGTNGRLTSPPWTYTQTTMTLYAGWQANITVVTLRLEGGRVGGSTSNIVVNVAYDSSPSFSVPTRTDYDFTGYYVSSGGGGTRVVGTNGRLSSPPWKYDRASMTLYAGWKLKRCPTCNSTNHTTTEYYQDCYSCGSWVDCAGYGSSCSCIYCSECGSYHSPPECSPPACGDCGRTGHDGCCGHGYSNSRDCSICNPPVWEVYCPYCDSYYTPGDGSMCAAGFAHIT